MMASNETYIALSLSPTLEKPAGSKKPRGSMAPTCKCKQVTRIALRARHCYMCFVAAS